MHKEKQTAARKIKHAGPHLRMPNEDSYFIGTFNFTLLSCILPFSPSEVGVLLLSSAIGGPDEGGL